VFVKNGMMQAIIQADIFPVHNFLLFLEIIEFKLLSEVSVVTQKANFTILAIKMHNASALYAET